MEPLSNVLQHQKSFENGKITFKEYRKLIRQNREELEELRSKFKSKPPQNEI
jgi:hypothetical protein